MLLSTVITVSTVTALSAAPRDEGVRTVADADVSRVRLHPLAVVHRWDRRRAAAWAHADPRALAGLYSAGSRAGRHDVATLEAYAARGLRVVGMRRQVVRLHVVHESELRLVLRVRGRVVDAVAVGRGGSVVLPTARPASYRTVLRRTTAGWKVVEATAVPRARRRARR
jgi:hypothetical protein